MDIRSYIKEILDSLPETYMYTEIPVCGDSSEVYPAVKYSEDSHFDFKDEVTNCEYCQQRIYLKFYFPYPSGCTEFYDAVDQSYEMLHELRKTAKTIFWVLTNYYGIVDSNGKIRKPIQRPTGREGGIRFRQSPFKKTEHHFLVMTASVLVNLPKAIDCCSIELIDKTKWASGATHKKALLARPTN